MPEMSSTAKIGWLNEKSKFIMPIHMHITYHNRRQNQFAPNLCVLCFVEYELHFRCCNYFFHHSNSKSVRCYGFCSNFSTLWLCVFFFSCVLCVHCVAFYRSFKWSCNTNPKLITVESYRLKHFMRGQKKNQANSVTGWTTATSMLKIMSVFCLSLFKIEN